MEGSANNVLPFFVRRRGVFAHPYCNTDVGLYVLNTDLKESVIFANKAAGYSVTKKYVMQAIPKLADIE